MNGSPVIRYKIVIDGESTDIGTANELATALDVLNGQEDRAVLEQLGSHLSEILHEPVGFMRVLQSLSLPDQLFLVDQMGPALAGVIRDARHLRDLFAVLSAVELESQILQTLGGHGLRRLILTGEELAEVLEWLYGQCDQHLLELLGSNYVSWIIRNARQLGQVLNSLDPAGQQRIIDMLGWERVVQWVRDGQDLAVLLRALPPSESKRLIGSFAPDRLVALIGNQRDWVYLYDRLEPAEADSLLSKLEVRHHAE